METVNKQGLVIRIGMLVKSKRENEENYGNVRNKSRPVSPFAQKKRSRENSSPGAGEATSETSHSPGHGQLNRGSG